MKLRKFTIAVILVVWIVTVILLAKNMLKEDVTYFHEKRIRYQSDSTIYTTGF